MRLALGTFIVNAVQAFAAKNEGSKAESTAKLAAIMLSELVVAILSSSATGIGAYFWGRRHAIQRSVMRRDPIQVHVEQDPGIIYANMPPWISFPYFIPMSPSNVPSPPASGDAQGLSAWWRWSNQHGGHSSTYSDLQVTITAWSDLTVVVDAFRVDVAACPDHEIGIAVLEPVGGAEIVLRQLQVDLNLFTPRVVATLAGGAASSHPFAFVLKPGETERFLLHIQSSNDAACYKWKGVLYLLVNNERKIVVIDDEGSRFHLHSQTPYFLHEAGQWLQQS